MTRPKPDPLAVIDEFQKYAENLRGFVSTLVADGWTDEQARVIVLQALISSAGTR